MSFSGYSVPHPTEDSMNVRVQSYSKDTNKIVINNLENISSICDVLKNKFEVSLNNFNNSKNKNKIK